MATYTSDDNTFQDDEYGYDTYEPGTVGTISLPNLTSIIGTDLSIVADGSGGEIDLPLLTSFDWGSLSVTGMAPLWLLTSRRSPAST